MGRQSHPPEGPQPNYVCPMCDSAVMGDRCQQCGRTQEEAKEASEEVMEARVGQFEKMLQVEDVHGFGPKQIDEISHENGSIKVVPRFRVSTQDILQLPGVTDAVYVADSGEPHLLLSYDPNPQQSMEDDMLGPFIEHTQVLANRHGPTRAQRMVSLYLSDPERFEETYDSLDTIERLAVKDLADYWAYFR